MFETRLTLTLLNVFVWNIRDNSSNRKIVYKKTDELYIEWQRVTTNGTTSDNVWQRVTTNGTTHDNEWQRVTTNDSEWYNEWQRMTTSGTTSDNEWYNEWQQVTTNDNEWQRVIISANFCFFSNKRRNTKHPKENFLNFEEDLWRRPIELRAETSP